MTLDYQVLDPRDLEDGQAAQRTFAVDVLIGLSERPKRLPSKYFYDARGSALFQRITELDAYYPTRCEFQIFERYRAEILDRFRGEPLNLVDLGAGDGRKTRVLLEHLVASGADVRYVPIDISEAAMQTVTAAMRRRFPSLPIAGLVSEYFDGVRWLGRQTDRRNLVLFLGSNVGNFDRPRARAFLRQLWNALNPDDHALIGFDLKKDIELLLDAYNDPEGVTAQFNLNMLRRINEELGGDFRLDRFRHFATYNVFSGAMESYLVSLDDQTVHIEALQQAFEFEPWEPIHTEYSYKFLPGDIDDLARSAGFATEEAWSDPDRWFCDVLWRVVKAGAAR